MSAIFKDYPIYIQEHPKCQVNGRFYLRIAAEYVKYPLITKKRMFYETMEEVLPDLKVIITGGNGTQTLLPLEPFSETASGSAAQTGGGN